MQGLGAFTTVMWLITWLVVVGSILAGMWLLFRVARARGWLDPAAHRSRARGILEERYARGEIDRDTFHRMLADLGYGG